MADLTADLVVQKMRTMMDGSWTYRFGAEVNGYPNSPLSRRVDCSEATEAAVRWAAESVGSSVRLPDGSYNQHDACYAAGTLIPLAQASRTPGALVFLSRVLEVTPGMGRNGIYHVGVVADRSTVLEACCRNGDVVGPVPFSQRNWYRRAGLIPGVVYPATNPSPRPPSGNQTTVVLQVEGGGTVSLRVLKKGSEGRDVREVQVMLTDWGFPLANDGAFGSATDSAVRGFQKARGLTVDGIVGERTYESLLGR